MSMRGPLFVLAVSALLVASCGKKVEEKAAERRLEKAIEKESGGKVKADISREKVEIKTEKGEMTITGAGGAEVPDGFPKDVHIYKDATVVMSAREQNTYSLVLQTNDDLKKVSETYKKEMTAQGWEEEAAINMGGMVMLQYKKAERAAAVSIATQDDKTQVTLSVQERE